MSVNLRFKKMTEKEIEWTNDHIIRLVNEYRARPVLWDTNHDLYRIQTAKYEAWFEISEVFGCDIVDLRKKFNSVFASYRREKAKIRMGGKSTWFLYNRLSFLPNHIENEESSETNTNPSKKKNYAEEPIVEAEPTSDEYENHGDESPVHIIIKEEPEIKTPPKMTHYHSKPRLTRVVKRKIVKENQIDRNKLQDRKYLRRSELYKKKDEYDSFGEYIAISLRKHDERTRSMIKQAINNILFEQEMKKYNNSAQYAVVLGMDDNPLIVPDDCDK